MVYKIHLCRINNDGSVTEGKRAQLFVSPQKLKIGGIYNLRSHRFYRVIEEIK